MTGVVVALQAGISLQVRVKAVLFGTLGTGFVGEVAFGHPNVVGTEDTFTGARERLGEDRNRRDTGTGTNRFAAQAFEDGLFIRRQGFTGESAVSQDEIITAVSTVVAFGIVT